MTTLPPDARIAILLPSYNEGRAIGKTVADFQAAVPTGKIYVYDNNSTDDTQAVAEAAGAIVRREPIQGKGAVVRRMFCDIDADIYIMADGDATYQASAAPALINALIANQADMVVGVRRTKAEAAYRPGHKLGNRLLTGLVAAVFNTGATDMLSGYRVFSRRFVKSFPTASRGFEIETELTVHAAELDMIVSEVETEYYARPEGSVSKLSTFQDGFRILWTILRFCREERPFTVFGLISVASVLLSLALGLPVVAEYWQTGLVPRLPTALLSAAIMIMGLLSLVTGLVLDSVRLARIETKRLRFLAIPGSAAFADK
jgi:glycosyltransferase involved in cell wall biosynthesis